MEELEKVKQELAETYEVLKERDETITDLGNRVEVLESIISDIHDLATNV